MNSSNNRNSSEGVYGSIGWVLPNNSTGNPASNSAICYCKKHNERQKIGSCAAHPNGVSTNNFSDSSIVGKLKSDSDHKANLDYLREKNSAYLKSSGPLSFRAINALESDNYFTDDSLGFELNQSSNNKKDNMPKSISKGLSHKKDCKLRHWSYEKRKDEECFCFPMTNAEHATYVTEREMLFIKDNAIEQPRPDHSKTNGIMSGASGSSTSFSGMCKNAISYFIGNDKQFRKSPQSEQEKMLAKYTTDFDEPAKADEDCSICITSLSEESSYISDKDKKRGLVGSVTLKLCGHSFHTCCLKQLMSTNCTLECPNCHTIHGVKTGTQPENGKMDVRTLNQTLPGFHKYKTIEITYSFPRGVQGSEHPNPGKPYNMVGFPRIAYIPDNEEGRKIVKLLKIAFDRRLIFTIGTSATTGNPDSVVWNDIHHKTSFDNSMGHGYPDPNYFKNVKQELANVGVTEDCPEFKKRQTRTPY